MICADVTNNGAVASVDPGTVHCAVVRYDSAADRLVHAELLNLYCTCPPERQGRGALELACEPGRSASSALSTKKVRVPTIHDLPSQIGARLRQHPKLFAGLDLMAVERQMPQSTNNMVVQSVLLARYPERSRHLAPTDLRRLWNKTAVKLSMAPCFRGGTHAVNKTDAKHLAKRVLRPSECVMLRTAAQRHAAHRLVCPVMQKRDRTRRTKKEKRNKKNKKAKTTKTTKTKKRKRGLKTDDLADAALQAIAAAQLHFAKSNATERRLLSSRPIKTEEDKPAAGDSRRGGSAAPSSARLRRASPPAKKRARHNLFTFLSKSTRTEGLCKKNGKHFLV